MFCDDNGHYRQKPGFGMRQEPLFIDDCRLRLPLLCRTHHDLPGCSTALTESERKMRQRIRPWLAGWPRTENAYRKRVDL